MKWVVSEKLGKWYGWDLGGLKKKMGGLAGEDGAPLTGFGKEAMREMRE